MVLVFKTSYSQQQWFPEKFDSVNKEYVMDTKGAFPVCFIKDVNGVLSMFGKNTNYETRMKKSGEKVYNSNHLILPFKNDNEELYSNASYKFTIININTGQLIIQRKGKPQEKIKFVLSQKKYKNINSRFG